MSNGISRDDLLKVASLIAASQLGSKKLQLTAAVIFDSIRKDEFWQLPPQPRKASVKRSGRKRGSVRPLESRPQPGEH